MFRVMLWPWITSIRPFLWALETTQGQNYIVIMADVNMESKVESGEGGNGSGATPVALSVDDVSVLVEEEPEVHQAAPDCPLRGNTG